VSDHDRFQLHSNSLTECVCKLCKNLYNDDKAFQKDLIIHDTSGNFNKNDRGQMIDHKASHVNTISVSQNSSTIKMFPCVSYDKVSIK